MSSKEAINLLNKGVLPETLNFLPREPEVIDWDKVRYNTIYNNREYWEQKFHPALHNLPAFNEIIDEIVEKNRNNTPLQQILEKEKEISIQYINESREKEER
jgi:hypothetical protein